MDKFDDIIVTLVFLESTGLLERAAVLGGSGDAGIDLTGEPEVIDLTGGPGVLALPGGEEQVLEQVLEGITFDEELCSVRADPPPKYENPPDYC